jgi:hypothetical protein
VIAWRWSPIATLIDRRGISTVDPAIPEGYSTVPPGLLEPARQFLRQHQRLYHVVSDDRGTRCEALTFRGGAVSDPYESEEYGPRQVVRTMYYYGLNRSEYGWDIDGELERRRYEQVSLVFRGPHVQRRSRSGRWLEYVLTRCESSLAIVDVEPAALVFIRGGWIRGYHPSAAQRLYTEAAACEASLPVVQQRLATHERTPDQINLGC